MALVKRKHLNLYKKYIEQIINDLGKTVTVVLGENEERCNNCKYDEVHHCSSGIYNGTGLKPFDGGICPVCNGKGVTYSFFRKISLPSSAPLLSAAFTPAVNFWSNV